MNKVVIFDMDGLMFDTERIFIKAWDYAGEKMGLGKAGYMAFKTMGMSIKESHQLWNSEFGEFYNEDELRKHTSDFIKNYYSKNKIPVKTGLYELLKYLNENGYRLGLASSSPKWEIEKHLHDHGICEYFEVIVSGDMVTKTKPHPDLYLLACSLLKVDTKQCIALEDSVNGILSAHNAGLKPIMIPDLVQPTEEIEKILYGKFSNLLEVINFLQE
ncbi:HAD family hydrolase [Clostridium hydrogenum]|uniref:HAD family hydrolase n=1 Tax=Clostridium hydrogenum TaxID=2855764 RepID=UPI001F4927DC|nr:HAD-IA family hydrolase [Clostridium hydrogenum]